MVGVLILLSLVTSLSMQFMMPADFDLGKFVGLKDVRAARVWTQTEVEGHKGVDPVEPILLSIMGDVYDVTAGKHFYAPGSSYHGLAGKDATLAFAIGDVSNEKEWAKPASEFKEGELEGLKSWVFFYRGKYKHVGVLEGYYYQKDGTKTPRLLEFEEKFMSIPDPKPDT